MDSDIREYIKNNFKDSNTDEIRDSIVESIESKDELVLPGLGVLFEAIWINSPDKTRASLVNKISKAFKKA